MPSGISIIHLDDDIIVIDKPPFVDTAIVKDGRAGSVAEQLLKLHPELSKVGRDANEAGLLNRLDRETSGLVLAARNQPAFEKLLKDMKAGKMEKKYLAVVSGVPDPIGDIRLPIGHMKKNRGKMAVEGGRRKIRGRSMEARTAYRRLSLAGGYSVLEVSITAGVMHQIRIHLSGAGWPIVGDLKYGGPRSASMNRQLLHSWKLSLPHPATGEIMVFEAPLPADMFAFISSRGLKI